MRGKCCVRIFGKIFWLEAKMFLKGCCVFHVKCRKLFPVRNQTCTPCISCMESKKYTCMGKFLQWKPTFSRKGTLYSKYSTRHSWPIATKLALFVSHACKVRSIHVWKIPPMEAEIQPKRYFVIQVQYPSFLTDRTKLSPFVAHAWEVRRVNIHENHCYS